MLRLTDPYRLYYSPLVLGFLLGFFIYLGLALLIVPGLLVPGWIWVAFLLVPLSGSVLQFASRRVVYIRGYQLIIISLMTLVYGTLLWAVLTHDQSDGFRLLAGFVVGAILVMLAVGGYWNNQRRYQRTRMPYGPVGTLDKKTGLVDPAISPPNIQRHQDRLEKRSALLWRLAPLTAGLAMLLVRGLPMSGKAVLIAIVALVTTAGSAGAAGGLYFYLVASRRWEREHGKRMCVKR